MERLPSNTFIKPSKIHGLGLFASRNIKTGERIIQGYADFNTFRDEWIVYVKKWKIKSFAHNNGYCMINHHSQPNTRRGKVLMVFASKNIKANEEITEDYFALPDEQNPFFGFDIEEIVWDAKNNYR